ncbi:hypothetical protein HID58_019597, partial [Brassica napus]
MPTFRMNPNLELQEFTQPLLKKEEFIQLPSHLSSLIIKVNIFAKADDLQNQAQPLEDFARRLKLKEKSVVTMVEKTFDQLVSNCPDNVHLEVNDYLTILLYKFGRNEKQNNLFHRVSLAEALFAFTTF